MTYYYNNNIIKWDNKELCPLCASTVLLKKQRPKDGCIKVRFYKCVNCEFDTRNLEMRSN